MEEWIKGVVHAHGGDITQPREERNKAICSGMGGPYGPRVSY